MSAADERRDGRTGQLRGESPRTGSNRASARPAREGVPHVARPGAGRPPRTTRPAAPAAPQRDVHVPDGVRLQKVLATAGLGSRRSCEILIEAGRVTVDGVLVRELGLRVDPERAVIHVDGMRIQLDTSLITIALNKPLGVVSTMHDPEGRPSLAQFVANRSERLFHVGRLDADTEGLLILTNDGDLAHRLQHPQYGVLKTYLAQIAGPVPRDLGRRLREGVELDDGPASVDSFRVVDSQPGRALVEVVLHEGRKHIVRRMLDAVGHPVLSLVRTQVGPIHLGDTKPGKMRKLNSDEVGKLYAAAGL